MRCHFVNEIQKRIHYKPRRQQDEKPSTLRLKSSWVERENHKNGQTSQKGRNETG